MTTTEKDIEEHDDALDCIDKCAVSHFGDPRMNCHEIAIAELCKLKEPLSQSIASMQQSVGSIETKIGEFISLSDSVASLSMQVAQLKEKEIETPRVSPRTTRNESNTK